MEGAPSGQVKIVWPDDALWPQGGYANTIAVNQTPWDFTIRLGHVVMPPFTAEDVPTETIEVELAPVAQVTLSPHAVLQLVLILQDQIAKYTAAHGSIGGRNPEEGITR